MDKPPGSLGWLIRMGLISGGSFLAGRGIGDAALWQEAVPPLMALGGALWSWWTTRRKPRAVTQ